MAQDGAAGGETILLVHIPKTAGTSIRWVAEQQYPVGSVQFLYPGTDRKLMRWRRPPVSASLQS